jgi:hypothetical protein
VNNSLQLQGFQALVISYILPGKEELQPQQEEQEEHNEETDNKETDSRLVLCNEKLLKLVNNVGDGLCLFTVYLHSLKDFIHKKNLFFLVSGCHIST